MTGPSAPRDYAAELLAGIEYDLGDELAGGRELPADDAAAYQLVRDAIQRVRAEGPFASRDEFAQRVSEAAAEAAGDNEGLASTTDDIVFGAGLIYDLREGFDHPSH